MILYEQHRKNSSEMSGYSINNILRFVRIKRRICSLNKRTNRNASTEDESPIDSGTFDPKESLIRNMI